MCAKRLEAAACWSKRSNIALGVQKAGNVIRGPQTVRTRNEKPNSNLNFKRWTVSEHNAVSIASDDSTYGIAVTRL